jgi:hypothetical protein
MTTTSPSPPHHHDHHITITIQNLILGMSDGPSFQSQS